MSVKLGNDKMQHAIAEVGARIQYTAPHQDMAPQNSVPCG